MDWREGPRSGFDSRYHSVCPAMLQAYKALCKVTTVVLIRLDSEGGKGATTRQFGMAKLLWQEASEAGLQEWR